MKLRTFLFSLIATLIVGVITAALMPSASASYPTGPAIVYFGDYYCAGNCIYGAGNGTQFMMYSTNGADRLGFGASGNFAGYVNGTSIAWFNANTTGVGSDLALQDDCNVVVYDSSWRARWASNSNVGQHVARCRISLGGDGHFSVWDYYDPTVCGCSLGWVRIISWGNGA